MKNKDFEQEKNSVGLEKEEIDEINNTEKNEKSGFVKSLCEWIDSFIVSFVAVVIIFTFFVGKVKVDGESMMDTLLDKDQLIVTDFCYNPQRGDIVIVSRNPENSDDSEKLKYNQPIVKRVIAVAGDTIEITEDGKVLLNDEELDEPYIRNYEDHLGTPQVNLVNKETVPEGCVFVMGDNRHNSHDSRTNDIWMVDKRYILGKVLLRVYPFENIKTFN